MTIKPRLFGIVAGFVITLTVVTALGMTEENITGHTWQAFEYHTNYLDYQGAGGGDQGANNGNTIEHSDNGMFLD